MNIHQKNILSRLKTLTAKELDDTKFDQLLNSNISLIDDLLKKYELSVDQIDAVLDLLEGGEIAMRKDSWSGEDVLQNQPQATEDQLARYEEIRNNQDKEDNITNEKTLKESPPVKEGPVKWYVKSTTFDRFGDQDHYYNTISLAEGYSPAVAAFSRGSIEDANDMLVSDYMEDMKGEISIKNVNKVCEEAMEDTIKISPTCWAFQMEEECIGVGRTKEEAKKAWNKVYVINDDDDWED